VFSFAFLLHRGHEHCLAIRCDVVCARVSARACVNDAPMTCTICNVVIMHSNASTPVLINVLAVAKELAALGIEQFGGVPKGPPM
jgi:hypothetical protein